MTYGHRLLSFLFNSVVCHLCIHKSTLAPKIALDAHIELSRKNYKEQSGVSERMDDRTRLERPCMAEERESEQEISILLVVYLEKSVRK